MERKEAIEVIKKNWPDSSFTMLREALETLIPELKESEGEKVRKELIKFVKVNIPNEERYIAWLEKQGEKSVDKLQASSELYEHIRNTCACIDDALSSETIADINDYLSMAERSAKSAFNMIEKRCEKGINGNDREIPFTEQKPLFKKGDTVIWDGEEFNILDVTKDFYNVGGYIIPIYRQNELSLKQKPAEEYNITGIGSKNAQGKLGEMIKNLKPVNEVLEQKPVDKVEPKFHEGEWINGYYTNYKVLSVNNDGYVVEDVDGNKINILFENEKFHHLFTIADAKDGDVLEYQGEIFIIRELKKKVIASRTIEYYCCYDGEHFINNSIYSLMDDDLVNIHPSTHEQHNLLLQKMHEAGYEWDAEKKELKKIEQRMVSAEAKEAMYSKPVEWSEKDEYNYNTILHHLDLRKEKYKKECNQEEQDRYQGLYDWLKSIRPQNMWKPSEEQMKALEWQVNNTSEGSWQYEESKNLLEQLKKLKG